MNGNMATQNSNLPAEQAADPFTAYAAKVTSTSGQFLSFDKGIWLFGPDKAKMQNGTRLAANVGGLMVGWRKWYGGRVEADLLEPLADQRPVPSRASLGDMDQSLWERDDRSGQARDPWVFTNTLQLVDDAGESYTYSASSKGGLNAIGQLCKVYGQEYRQRPGMVPIVELGGDSYMHSNSEYGLIHTPVLKVVGWTDRAAIDVGGEGEAPPAPEKDQRAGPPTPAAATPPTTRPSEPRRTPRF